MASDDPMRFVYYTVKTDLIPEEFNIPKELNDVLNMKFENPEYEKEKQLIQKYTSLKRDTSSVAPLRFADNDRIRKSPLTTPKVNEVDATDLPMPGPPQRVTSMNSKSNSVVNEFEHRHSLVQRMMTETSQEQSTCHFFLESSDWNYDTAIDMFDRMQMT